MKKMSLPDTAGGASPEWIAAVRDNIEVITGRRNNKITLPTVQHITFSSPPTQAECQALNAYVNEWYKAMGLLVARFDT